MTFKIPLSQSGPADQFAAALEAHRTELEQHRIGPHGVPAPVAHELIDQLIARVPQSGPVESRGPDQFVIVPYEIFDDTPPPPTLEQRKQMLQGEIYQAAQAARDSILTPARANLLNLQFAEAIGTPDDHRSPAEQSTIDAYTAFQSRCVEIAHNAAHAAIEVEELTEATIDEWKIPSF